MKKRIDKVCQKHGMTEHVEEVGGYFRCKRCRNNHTIERRKTVKLQLVQQFGGKCKVCLYDRCIGNLTFHHLDPSVKDFNVSAKGQSLSLERVKREAEKCVLLCCRCHGELHAGLISV